MAEQALALREYPQIIELLSILEQNGLRKEKDEVQSLVIYIGDMEDKLAQMMGELREMRGEVKQIHDSGLHAKCTRLLDSVQSKIEQTKETVQTVKQNFVRAAGNAVRVFKEKGRTALLQAVNAMKITAVLVHLKNGSHIAAQSMQEAAGKVDATREQLHEVGSHLKNAGRALLGRPAKQLEKLEADKVFLPSSAISLRERKKRFSAWKKVLILFRKNSGTIKRRRKRNPRSSRN